MSTVADVSPPMVWITVADLFEQLGHVPQERVLLVPTPGTATEKDVLDLIDHSDRICELVDGVLVEKTMGYLESMLAGAILELLRIRTQTQTRNCPWGGWNVEDSTQSSADSRRLLHKLGPISRGQTTEDADSRRRTGLGRRSALRQQHGGRNAAEVAGLLHRRRSPSLVR